MFCRKEGKHIELISRNWQDWTRRTSVLAREAEQLKADTAVLDGEVVVPAARRQDELSGTPEHLEQIESGQLVYYDFDLLYFDGHDLSAVPLIDRKRLLDVLQRDSALARVVYCDHTRGHGPEVFVEASRMGVEGIISKRRDGPYCPGRTSSWNKAKCIQSGEF